MAGLPSHAPSALPGRGGLAGIGLALLAFGLYSLMDVTVKLLAARYPVTQIIALNAFFGLIPITAYAAHQGGLVRYLRTRRPWLHGMRSCFSIISSFLGFYAFSKMPIADVYALAFTAPLFITLMSALVLKEPVGWRRFAAVAVGFAGVLFMLRPGAGVFNPAAFAVLGSAFFYSMSMVLVRSAKSSESGVSFALYVTLGNMFFYGVIAAFSGRWPDWGDLGLSCLGGVASGAGAVALATAFQKAPAAVVAPFQYTQILWGLLYGSLIFGNKPDPDMFIGVAIIMGSGLYILHREGVRRRIAAGHA
jgi:drug/metabolite transporter (DMT)-like permease